MTATRRRAGAAAASLLLAAAAVVDRTARAFAPSPPSPSSPRRAASRRRGAADDGRTARVAVAAAPHGFDALGLADDLVAAARRMRWEVPTPVQRLAVPAILDAAAGGGGHGSGSGPDGGASLWCEGPTGR